MNANIRRASKVAEATQPWMDDRQEVTASVNEQRITITEERPTDLNIEGAARGAATYRGDRIANEKLAKFSGGGALFAATLGGGKDLIAGDPAPDDWMNSCAAVLRGSGHAAMALMDYRSGASFIRGGAGKVHVGYSDVDGFGAADVLLGDALVAAQNGRVGVGVGAPAAPLHVSGEYPQLLLQHETTEQEASIGVTDEGGLEVIAPNGHTRVFGRTQVDTLAAGAVIATRTHTSSLLLDKIMSLNGSILIGASAAYLSYDCAVPAMIQRSNPFTPATQTVFVVGVDERVNEAGVQVFDVGATIRFYWMTRTTATTSSLVYVEASIVSYIGRDASDATRPVAVQTYEVRVTSYPPYSDSYSSPNLYPTFTLPEGVMVIQATSDAEITSRIAGKPLIRVGATYIGWDGDKLIGGVQTTQPASGLRLGVVAGGSDNDYLNFNYYTNGVKFFESGSTYGLGGDVYFKLGDPAARMLTFSGKGASGASIQSLYIDATSLKVGGVSVALSTDLAAYQPLDVDLTAIAAIGSTGWLKRTASNTWGVYSLAESDVSGLVSDLASLSAGIAASQPLDATLTALAGVATAADKLIYATGSDAFATADFSAFGRTLVDDASASVARATLGLVIGTDVLAFGSVSGTSGYIPKFTGTNAIGNSLITDDGTNITIVGTGKRLRADFSDTTHANRLMLQSSTANGVSIIGVIPNGISANAGVRVYNSSDPDNACALQTIIDANQSRLNVAVTGTGVLVPLRFQMNSTTRVEVDTSGNIVLTPAGTLTMSDKDFVLGTTTGTKFGTSISQKLAFYNATPIAQRSGAAQAAVATTGATNSSPYGFTTAAQADAIVTLVNEVRAAMVALGLIKGSA